MRRKKAENVLVVVSVYMRIYNDEKVGKRKRKVEDSGIYRRGSLSDYSDIEIKFTRAT